jgi:hypothetical protein
MGVTNIVNAAELTGGAVVFLLFVYRQVRTGARDAWRDVAESQEKRAEVLAGQVETLVVEVRALRVENDALRVEVAELRAENRELRFHIDTLIGGDEA